MTDALAIAKQVDIFINQLTFDFIIDRRVSTSSTRLTWSRTTTGLDPSVLEKVMGHCTTTSTTTA